MALKQYGERYPTGMRHLKICDDIFYNVAFNPDQKLAIGYGCGMETVIDDGTNPWSKPPMPDKGSQSTSSMSTPADVLGEARIRTASMTSGSTGLSPVDQAGSSSSYTRHVVPLEGSSGPNGGAQPAPPLLDGSMLNGYPSTSNQSASMPFMSDPLQQRTFQQQPKTQAADANGNGNMNGFTWNNSTPFAAATLMQTQQHQQQNASMLFGTNFFNAEGIQTNGLSQGQEQQPSVTDQMLDFTFDISSFSYDLDSLPNLFADSQAIFDGQDFVWKAED